VTFLVPAYVLLNDATAARGLQPDGDHCRGECLDPLAAVASPKPMYTAPET